MILIRCMEKQYANDFINGELFFNNVNNWIKEELSNGKGRGDALEGTFFGLPKNVGIALKNTKDYEEFIYGDFKHYRKKDIKKQYCLCFYTCEISDFSYYTDDKGKTQLTSTVAAKYFSDFSNGVSEDEYDSIADARKPVVILIHNEELFLQKVKEGLVNLGVSEDDIYMSRVQYIDKCKPYKIHVKFPKELFFKPSEFSSQSEFRITFVIRDSKVYEKLKSHNNKVSIGNIEDILIVLDYYFNEMCLALEYPNHLLYSLPKPIIHDFDNFNLLKLISSYMYFAKGVRFKDPHINDYINGGTAQDVANYFAKLLLDKYQLSIGLDDNGQCVITGMTDEVNKLLVTQIAETMKKKKL